MNEDPPAIRDRTRQHEIREALRRKDEQLSRLIASAPGVICSFLMQADGSFAMPFASPAIEDIYGLTPEQVARDTTLLFAGIHPDDRLEVERTVTESARTMTPWRAEYRYQHPTKGERWLEGRSAPQREPDGNILWHGIIQDVTERKRAVEALRRSEERLQTVLDNLGEGLVVSDLDGQLLHWNPAALAMHEFSSAEEWLRKLPEFIDIFELSTLDGRVIPFEEWPMPRIYRGEQVREYELTIRRKEIPWERVFRYGGSIVTQPDGSKIAILTVIDVTERVRARRELERLNAELDVRVRERTAQLEASNKELEAFSYSVSHDLRAPLRAVNGFAEMLLEDYSPQLPDEGRRLIHVIRESGRRMGTLIDDLLALSRLGRQTMKPRAIDVDRLVREVIAELTRRREGPPVELHVGPLAPCGGDPTLVRQLWVNLLSNAFKYSSRRERPVIEVGCERRDHTTTWFVRDNGVGFDMAYAHKLFGVFQRLHRTDEFEGAGVGLAIAARVVARHGGRIWADAAPDRGATFFFTLNENRGA